MDLTKQLLSKQIGRKTWTEVEESVSHAIETFAATGGLIP